MADPPPEGEGPVGRHRALRRAESWCGTAQGCRAGEGAVTHQVPLNNPEKNTRHYVPWCPHTYPVLRGQGLWVGRGKPGEGGLHPHPSRQPDSGPGYLALWFFSSHPSCCPPLAWWVGKGTTAQKQGLKRLCERGAGAGQSSQATGLAAPIRPCPSDLHPFWWPSLP